VRVDAATRTVAGDGVAFAELPVSQDKVYYEVHVAKAGKVGAGLAWLGKEVSLEPGQSWVLDVTAAAGDVIGVLFDQGDFPPRLEFTMNASPAGSPDLGRGIKGEVWPCVRVDQGEVAFAFAHSDCKHAAGPSGRGFGQLLRSSDLI
jgi:hypothetical protein